MLWLTWRQFRTQAIVGAIALAAAAAYLLVLGAHIRSDYRHAVAGCITTGCAPGVVAGFENRYHTLITVTDLVLIAVPGLLGVFWGAPLISSELAAGTHRLAWHQGVTRTRWLTVKLLFIGLTSVAFTGLLSLLLTWGTRPYDNLEADRFSALAFATRGVTPLAYATFAFTFAAAAGLLLRRPVAAMALTMAVFTAAQFLVPTLLRPDYLPPRTTDIHLDATTLRHADGIMLSGSSLAIGRISVPDAWVISAGHAVDSGGHAPSAAELADCISPGRFAHTIDCLAQQDLHVSATYQPDSRYWPFQLIEAALYAAAAAFCAVLCFSWIRRRTA